jgi:Family of unknown function (DUF6518)
VVAPAAAEEGDAVRVFGIGVAVLVAGGLLGGGMQVAERVFGLPNSVSALGAPWLVCAFAVGALIRGRVAATVAGASLLGIGTALYYAAIVYAYGSSSAGYAAAMTVAWGALAAAGGGGMALAGSLWRDATGWRAALLAAPPAAALIGEAALLSRSWEGDAGAMALSGEVLAAVALLLALTWGRVRLTHATVMTCVMAVAFAVVEAEVRGVMRAAGWHGA